MGLLAHRGAVRASGIDPAPAALTPGFRSNCGLNHTLLRLYAPAAAPGPRGADVNNCHVLFCSLLINAF